MDKEKKLTAKIATKLLVASIKSGTSKLSGVHLEKDTKEALKCAKLIVSESRTL